MVGREGWWEGMTIDVALSPLQDLQQFKGLPGSSCRLCHSFCTRSKKQEATGKEKKKGNWGNIFSPGQVK